MTQTYQENGTIVGYFEDQGSAHQALEQLQSAGFASAHLGVAHRGPASTRDGAHTDSAGTTTRNSDEPSVWEKIKNFFEGGTEAYAEERTEGDLATREITSNPADTRTYGRQDLHESLSGMSVPQNRSQYFGDRFHSSENGAIITVNAGTRAAEAEEILRDNGADLGETASQYASESTATTGETGQTEGLQNLQLLGEVLRVHKDRVSRGDVTIRKDVVTENQTIQVPVTREELVVERHEVTGDAQASGTIGEGREIRIPLTEETASIDKGTVVREEVAVGKRPVGEVRDLAGEVRHEELVVDDQTKRAVNQ